MIILFTSALTENLFEQRKEEYIISFNTLCSFGYKNNIQIIECINNSEDSFLNTLTEKVFYTKQNYAYRNKGVNELLNIKFFLENFNVDDEEKIVKLTGRYNLLDNSFIKEFENSSCDVLYKKDSVNQVFFGCLCLKKKVLTNFINQLNFNVLESNLVCIEKSFADFIYKSEYEQKVIEKINIRCNINNEDLHTL